MAVAAHSQGAAFLLLIDDLEPLARARGHPRGALADLAALGLAGTARRAPVRESELYAGAIPRLDAEAGC